MGELALGIITSRAANSESGRVHSLPTPPRGDIPIILGGNSRVRERLLRYRDEVLDKLA